MTTDSDLLAGALVDLAHAQAQQVGARAWADVVPHGHPDHLAAHQRAHDAHEAAGIALWAVAFELYGRGRIANGADLADEVNAFAERMHHAWKEGYCAGFDGHDWDTSDVVGFDDDVLADATPAVQLVDVDVSLERRACPACSGFGYHDDDGDGELCERCNGDGVVAVETAVVTGDRL